MSRSSSVPLRRALLVIALGTTATTLPATAAPILLATGSLTGSSAGQNADLSGQTAPLENGLPGNLLGGLGSALAWAGGNTFLAAPDRGPNATSYASSVDDTTSYIARFQTLQLNLTPSTGGSTPFVLSPTLVATTLLSSSSPLNYGSGAGLVRNDGTPVGSGVPVANTAAKNYFTGRSDNFGPGTSGNANDARLDPEGLRLSNDGRSVFVSDEYGPYVYQFDRATGSRIRTYTLPANLYVANLSPNGATEISGNTSGRVANKGMEGLAITPDGKTLVGIVQNALIQDQAAAPKLLRIVTIDVASGTTHEYGYLLSSGSGVSEITAINDHQFLVDERDGKGLGDGSNAKVKQFFMIDLNGATDITDLTGAAAAAVAIAKSPAPTVDLVPLLAMNGISAANVPSKIEGLAFGQDIVLNGVVEHTLYVANDNDFVPGTSGPSLFYVIGLTDADLKATFVPQAIPEPGALPLVGLGAVALVASRRKRRAGHRPV